MIISVFSITLIKDLPKKPTYIPVELVMVQPKVVPKKKVLSKQMVSKKSVPKSKKAAKVTSLPGDRVKPVISKYLQPVYPKMALNNDWEGTVKVKAGINALGKVQSITILKSTGHQVLDAAFIRAIKQSYQFKPKRSMGKNTSGTIILSHSFSISESG